MLTKLYRLGVELEGRYAKPEELEFVKNYLQSTDLRLSAYKKIEDNAGEIIDSVEAKMKAQDPNALINGGKDVSRIWRRDITNILKYSAATLLFDASDHLRDGLLLWHKSIAKSFHFEPHTYNTFETMKVVVQEYLTKEEATLFCQVLQLDEVILT